MIWCFWLVDPENPSPPSPGAGAPSTYPGLSPPPVSQGTKRHNLRYTFSYLLYVWILLIFPNFAVPFNPQPFTPPSRSPDSGMTRPQTPEGDLVPTLTPPGMRPTLSAAAQPSQTVLSSLLVAMMGVFLLKYCWLW